MKTYHVIIGGLVLAAATALAPRTNPLNQLATTRVSGINPTPVSPPSNLTPVTNQTTTAVRQDHDKAITVSVSSNPKGHNANLPKGCVFKTAFEADGIDPNMQYPMPAKVNRSLDRSLSWLADAQNRDGGWGAGTHNRQDVLDPHAVKSDPATTAMVALSLLRSGSTLSTGPYADQLGEATNYLLECVEASNSQDLNITDLTGTQPQVKLGRNIDVSLTSQYLTALLNYGPLQQEDRIRKAIRKCVKKIERGQSANGSQSNSGWAGVLQSSMATNALEMAKDNNIEVNDQVLNAARDYQKSNVDVENENVATESAAGIVLYSVSGSARASAQEAAEAKTALKKAKKEGKIPASADVSVENLEKAGLSQSEALKYNTAYQVNESAKRIAQRDEVMSGFGNNGGEEFLSYLQTGEGLIMSHDQSWKNWYDKMSGRLLEIQNNDGSWSGHHCITSPVFCTATSILILAITNDVQNLAKTIEAQER